MDIISRAKWGARAPRSRSTVKWSQRTEFVVHYSEGPTSQSVRSIQDFHMDGRGWSDIGYNFLVDVSGRIYEGRGWLVVGAHAPDHNTSGIGVCMIGRDGDSTAAAKKAIRWLYDQACKKADRKLAKLGHRDVYATSCPGNELYAWLRAGMPAESEEDDVSAGDLWDHRIGVPDYAKDLHPKAKEYAAGGWLRGAEIQARRARIAAEANGAAISELAAALGKLAADRGQTVDVDALVARITEQIERVTVRLAVEDAEDAG